jgi:hypothetical protein
MRRGLRGELGAVPGTRSRDAAADGMPRDGREDDRVPAHGAGRAIARHPGRQLSPVPRRRTMPMLMISWSFGCGLHGW